MGWYRGSWIFPAIMAVIVLSWLDWPFWMVGFLWFAPWFFGGASHFGGGCNDQEYDERKRKVKNEEQWENRTSTYEPFRDDTRRRIIRTADGEFMTAIEDPATGMLILEERESNKS